MASSELLVERDENSALSALLLQVGQYLVFEVDRQMHLGILAGELPALAAGKSYSLRIAVCPSPIEEAAGHVLLVGPELIDPPPSTTFSAYELE